MAPPDTPSPPTTRVPLQLAVLVVALVLWVIVPSPRLWTLVAAYGVAWAIFNYGTRGQRALALPWSRSTVALGLAVLLAVPLAALWRLGGELVAAEGFRGFSQLTADRTRLEDLPAIAPPTVHFDHPQSFYVQAPGATQVDLELGPGTRQLAGVALGHGLFRIDFDPRRDGVPAGPGESLEATLVVDSRRVRRRLEAVRFAAHPRWFSSAPAAGLAATVSEETDEVFIVSRRGLEHRLASADGPSDCVFFDSGRRLAVVHRYSPELWVIDPRTGEHLGSIELEVFQHRLAVSPDGSRLAVAVQGLEPGLLWVDGATLEPVGRIQTDFRPDWIAFGADATTLVASSAEHRALYKLRQVDGGWRVDALLELGRPPVTLARSPDGRRLRVAVTDYRPGGVDHRGNHFIQDQILTVDLDRFEVVDQLLTARRDSRQDFPGDVDRGASPMGIVEREDGTLLVAFAGSDEVWEIDPDHRLPPRLHDGLDLDLIIPHGVADLGEGFWAASSPVGGAMAVYSPSGEIVDYLGVTPTNGELAEHPAGSLGRQTLVLRRGEANFYEATRSGVSCQSCHLHGGTDYSPHDIGQVKVLHTLSSRGVAGTSPYLRDASYPRIRDLDRHLAATLYRGYRRFSPTRGTDLETFVEALPRTVNPRRLAPRDLERERAGLDAFVEAGCETCHHLPAFTNLSRHPARTLFPDYGQDLPPTVALDTPSLLGLHDKPHLLHDGRAHDLEAVLGEHNAANRHGDSRALGPDERAALAHFLLSL